MGPHGGIRFGRRQRRPAAGHRRIGGPRLRVRDAVAAQARRAPAASLPMRRRGSLTRARATRQHRAHRRERVAGDPAGPDQFPQRRFELGFADSVLAELSKEERAAAGQHVQDRAMGRGELDLSIRQPASAARNRRCGRPPSRRCRRSCPTLTTSPRRRPAVRRASRGSSRAPAAPAPAIRPPTRVVGRRRADR